MDETTRETDHVVAAVQFPIPEDTFYDVEDGYTPKLELGFYLENGQPPPADYWIQFNNENQFLYALSTERHIGKHHFLLTASDSGGQMVTERLEVHVRQLPASRSFHHTFTLYQVTWDQVRYPVRDENGSIVLCVCVAKLRNNRPETHLMSSRSLWHRCCTLDNAPDCLSSDASYYVTLAHLLLSHSSYFRC